MQTEFLVKFQPKRNIYYMLTNPLITHAMRQIIAGSILGGSSIIKNPANKNAYLLMRSNNSEWLYYKTSELKDLASDHAFIKEGNTLRWRSGCYPVFNEFYKDFYKSKKRIVPKDALESICDLGLAVWFYDKGKIEKDEVIMNTHIFGEKGTKTILEYFNDDAIKIDSKLYKENNSFRIKMTKPGSIKFLNTISHCLPEKLFIKKCK